MRAASLGLVMKPSSDGEILKISKFPCEYRAVRREEMTNALLSLGCRKVTWRFPEETGFYQPIVVAQK